MRVSSIHLRAITEALAWGGLDSTAFRARAGLEEERLADSYGWFDVADLDRSIDVAVELTGDEAFGLHWGDQSPMMKYDLMSPLIAQAPTLGAGLQAILRFQCILAERPEVELIERHNSVLIRCEPLANSALARRVRSDCMVMAVMRLVRYLGIPTSSVRRVSIAHPRPSYHDEYVRLLGLEPKFDAAATEVEIDRAELDRPQPNRNPELHQLLSAQAERIRSRVLSEFSYSERVRKELRGALPQLLEMPEVARTLGISERSLRRRLSEEGNSFSALVEASQIDLARELLEDRLRTVKEVAHRVGFDSVSGFHRAFRRWTGASPARVRGQSRFQDEPANKPS